MGARGSKERRETRASRKEARKNARDSPAKIEAANGEPSNRKKREKKDSTTLNDEKEEEELFNPSGKKVCAEDFELLTVVGKGSFGKVMQVKKKDDGKIYAMKVLRKEAIIARKQVTHTRAEKSILQKISHPFIVKLHFAFQTQDKLYMIMDYVNGGELFHHLKKEGRFSEERVRFYSAQIACAIGHLHGLGVVYRDLKPENILLDMKGHICITDFGLSKEITPQEGTHTFCGTPEYLAPEVLKGQGHGTAVDWWSLGTLMYEMLTGLPPFYSQNINIMYQKILNSDLRFPSYVSPDAQDILQGFLTRDIDSRLGSGPDGMDNIKNHTFFKTLDWVKLEAKEVEAPFLPDVASATDTNEIDQCFKEEKALDSYVDNHLSEDVAKANNFTDFTFVAPSALAGNG